MCFKETKIGKGIPGSNGIGRARGQLEDRLRDSLGVRHFIWLGEGIAGDDTDGHIDDIARFVDPTTVVCAVEPKPNDDNYSTLQQNFERLQSATDQDGGRLSVVALPCPGPVFYDGARLPASYANFYIANDVVIVPVFDDPADRVALDTLAGVFPGRQIRALNAVDLVWGLGAFHCITQQQPA